MGKEVSPAWRLEQLRVLRDGYVQHKDEMRRVMRKGAYEVELAWLEDNIRELEQRVSNPSGQDEAAIAPAAAEGVR